MTVLCFIELGSNESSDRKIQDARLVLRECFPDIVFSRMLTTEPQDFESSRPFLNQTGRFTTRKTEEEVRRILKSIEKQLGREPDDKAKGRVRIDIDLLMYNGTALKAKDLQREYVRAGLAELNGQPV